MMRVVAFSAVAMAAAAALVLDTVGSAPALPFYDSADLTARWTRSVDHRIADFSLITQTGRRLSRADLMGRVHVASFIYTSCAGVCPVIVTQLAKIQKVIDGSSAVLVSYSVTPEHDTPETLVRFGDARGIDPSRWKLVTGDAEQIHRLARSSYFADDSRKLEGDLDGQFLHTEKALLVDQDGRLRGVYNATLPHEIDKLKADLARLLDER